ncbi:hypothetical protein Ptr902_14186 [Pyrenophora tritici-repentis]|nr:hypothetical protein Ptr902_14186 [Pyrenophora tritici-repentis]
MAFFTGRVTRSRPRSPKARPDADAHFDFVDDGTPESQRQHPTKGGRSNRGQGDVKSALSDVSRRQRGPLKALCLAVRYDGQQPRAGKNGAAAATQTRNSMKTHWGTHQDSPENRGINIAGKRYGWPQGH